MPWPTTSRHERGYGKEWDKLRKQALTRDKHLCQPSRRNHRITPATQVDHKTPKAKGGTDHLSNLQSICEPCHKAKTAQENGQTARPAIGLDGWPA